MENVSHVWRVIDDWLSQVQFRPSQSRLAELVGVARSAVSDWKSGKSRPTPEHLLALAQLMEPTVGPGAHDELVMAVVADMGYITTEVFERELAYTRNALALERQGGEVRELRTAATKEPATEPAEQSVKTAARKVKRKGSNQE